MTGYKSIDFKDLNKPFIDEFGQDKNSSWNGKIKTIQHLEETGKQDMKKFTEAFSKMVELQLSISGIPKQINWFLRTN